MSINEIVEQIEKLKDAPKIERFSDREGGLLIPNHNIADLKVLCNHVRKLEADLATAVKALESFALEDSTCYEWDGSDYRGKKIAEAALEKIRAGSGEGESK